MAHEKNHDYHIIDPSPWPFLGALGGFTMLAGTIIMVSPYAKANGFDTPVVFLIGLAVGNLVSAVIGPVWSFVIAVALIAVFLLWVQRRLSWQ